MKVPTNILVATDFSDNADTALDYAVALAHKLDAKIHLLNVIGLPLSDFPSSWESSISSVLADNQKELDRLASSHASEAMFGPTLLKVANARDVYDLIDTTATEVAADLIVMGTHGRSGITRLLHGSVAESVVRTALCPVLVIRAT
jgi:nucleotide-binding universal stress UspA family protein